MEHRLSGGGRNDGAVRVGQTVRRRAGTHTLAIHALLRHLKAVGFAGAPRVLGIDYQGREVLTYLDGETVGDPPDPGPPGRASDTALIAAGCATSTPHPDLRTAARDAVVRRPRRSSPRRTDRTPRRGAVQRRVARRTHGVRPQPRGIAAVTLTWLLGAPKPLPRPARAGARAGRTLWLPRRRAVG